MSKVSVQLRCDGTVVSGLDGVAERLGYSRNELMVLILGAGVKTLDGWTSPADALAEGIGAELAKVIPKDEKTQIAEKERGRLTAFTEVLGGEPSEGRHFHRFVRVEGSEHPGKLLGTVEAEFECPCGKSKMEQVKR